MNKLDYKSKNPIPNILWSLETNLRYKFFVSKQRHSKQTFNVIGRLGVDGPLLELVRTTVLGLEPAPVGTALDDVELSWCDVELSWRCSLTLLTFTTTVFWLMLLVVPDVGVEDYENYIIL